MAVFVESFEGTSATANSPVHPLSSHFVQPGFLSAYTFPSGVRLLSPFPNNKFAPAALVGDFLRTNFSPTLLGNGNVTAADVPTGTGYMLFTASAEFSFAFDINVYSVGAYVDAIGSPGIIAYDASGKLISGARINSVPVADWDTNYIQVLSKVPIAKVVFTIAGNVVVDDLTFDTEKPKIVKGTGADDQLNASAPGDASPSNKAELIYGKNGNDKIKAQGGDDTVDGGKGNDKVRGGDGNDTIIVGKGDDKARGEAGQDTFLFNKLSSKTVLKDFSVTDDSIFLSLAAFPALSVGSITKAQFFIGAAASDDTDRIIYDPATGKLLYDADGNGAGAAVVFAKLPVGLALDGGEFLVV